MVGGHWSDTGSGNGGLSCFPDLVVRGVSSVAFTGSIGGGQGQLGHLIEGRRRDSNRPSKSYGTYDFRKGVDDILENFGGNVIILL